MTSIPASSENPPVRRSDRTHRTGRTRPGKPAGHPGSRNQGPVSIIDALVLAAAVPTDLPTNGYSFAEPKARNDAQYTDAPRTLRSPSILGISSTFRSGSTESFAGLMTVKLQVPGV